MPSLAIREDALHRVSRVSSTEQVILKIETIIHNILEDLSAGQDLAVPLRTRTSNREQQTQYIRGNYSFPASSHRSAWRFTVVLSILNAIHKALVSDTIVSKRDIYYQDPDLYGSQAVVDKYIDDIAFTFEVSRNDLNVLAEAKGLLSGPLIQSKDDGTVNTTAYNDGEVYGTAVPLSSQYHTISISAETPPNFILVIEKKATFHTLSRANVHIKYNCILLTGQGYPDLATRSFLHHFHTTLAPQVPCYALVDFDPDGLGIYHVYAHGSRALAHEKDTTVPDLKLLGLRSEDTFTMIRNTLEPSFDSMVHSRRAIEVADQGPGMAYLSLRERHRAKGLLARLEQDSANDSGDEERRLYLLERWGWQETAYEQARAQNKLDLKRELQMCLMIGYKVEIQIMDRREGGLEAWLSSKTGASSY